MKRAKILITGANGFTGRHACRYFHQSGYECIALTRKREPLLEASKNIICHLLNREEVERVIKQTNPDYILHLAAQNHVGKSWEDPVHTIETNVLTTLYILEAIRQVNPACKIIVAGSTLQFNPQNLSTLPHPYSLSKTLQTLIAQSWESLFNMNIIIAKPSNLIGPGESNGICSIIAKKIVEMERSEGDNIVEVSNLQARRDFLDVRDAVRAFETLFRLGERGAIYEIATGTTLSLEEVINLFKLHSDASFSVMGKNNRAGDVFQGNPEAIEKLGWKPLISSSESFRDILNYYRS